MPDEEQAPLRKRISQALRGQRELYAFERWLIYGAILTCGWDWVLDLAPKAAALVGA